MRKIFEVELSSENGCAELALPATPYELLDALEKLRLEEGETPRWEIVGPPDCEALADAFTGEGYVLRHSELAQAYKTLDLTLKKPDYTILAETASGHEVKFPFPANGPMGTEPVRCADCAAPALIGISGGMERMDLLARRLGELEADGELPKFKALLEAVGCRELESALLLIDSLDRYVFAPELRTPEEVAMANLNVVMPDDEVEFMAPYLDLFAYGQALVKQGGGMLTGSGLIERIDGQSMQMPEEKQELQGMELQ